MEINPSFPKMPFKKGYIWCLNLNAEKEGSEQISSWFIKPGTETDKDYLFHAFSFVDTIQHGDSETILHAKGSHLCVKDMYDTEYWFHLQNQDGKSTTLSSPTLNRWRMRHVVKGPKKDQIIETTFTKDH